MVFEIAPTLFTWAAIIHVWHMNVLLYAVFKDQRTRHSLALSDRITLA